MIKKSIALISLCTLLIACGSSVSQSGADVDSTTADIAGVYEGNEIIKLIRSATGDTQDTGENTVTFTLNSTGLLRYTSSNGSSGSTQIRNDRSFQLQSEAVTQFNGLCQSGLIYLDGQINDTTLTGVYRSENLICGGDAFFIIGTLKAVRK